MEKISRAEMIGLMVVVGLVGATVACNLADAVYWVGVEWGEIKEIMSRW